MVVKQDGGQIGSAGKRCPCSTLVKQKMVKRDTLTIIDDGRTRRGQTGWWPMGMVKRYARQTRCGSTEQISVQRSGSWSNGKQWSNRTVVKRARLVSRGCRSGAVPRVSPAIQHPPLRVSPLGPAPASHARLRACPPRAPLRPTRMSAAGPGPPQPCRPGSVRACSVQANAPHASARLPPLLPPPPP